MVIGLKKGVLKMLKNIKKYLIGKNILTPHIIKRGKMIG